MGKLSGIARAWRSEIVDGIMLAIDPGSGSRGNNAGYALFAGGELVESGTLYEEWETRLPIYDRLRILRDKLQPLNIADVLAIEQIRSRSHTYLRWACGVTIAVLDAPRVVEVPPQVWHRFVGPDYVKTDERDAQSIGYCVLSYSLGGNP